MTINGKNQTLSERNIEDILALTPMQEGMLFHYLKDPQQDYYFEQLSLEISGEINGELFDKAWNFVIQTNEMLRTVFRWEKMNKPIQVVLKQYKIKPIIIDLSAEKIEEKENRLEDIKIKDRNKKFDLRSVPFRVTLGKMAADKYVMIISNHHILYDGWSNGIILKEFFGAYDESGINKTFIPPVKTKFKEFIQWTQNQDLNKQNREKFWRNFLKGFDIPTRLAIKKQKRGKKVTLPGKYSARLGRNITIELNRFTREHKLTFASFLYTAWGLLLQRYNNLDDVIFGTTVSGRSAKLKGIEDIVGLFINTLPLRIKTIPGEKILDCLLRTHYMLQNREEFERSSLVEIREYGQVNTDEELFDSIVVMENYPLDIRLLEGNKELSLNSYSMFEMTHYDLTVAVSTVEDIKIDLSYNQELLDKDTIERLSRHFVLLIGTIIKNPGKKIREIEIISKEEKRQILFEFNDTRAEYPQNKRIHELFAQQAKQNPDNIAVIGMTQGVGARFIASHPGKRNMHITYSKLNRKSNQLAHLLKEKGVTADTIVGIMMERSIEMIVGILGILKAGGAYLPIDPEYPEERINYMLEDSSANTLVTTGTLAKEGENLRSSEVKRGHETIFIDTLDFSNLSSSHLLNFSTSPSSLAYIIYTSGTTGKPKGVMLEHKGIANLKVFWAHEKGFGVNSQDHILQFANITFDASVSEFFMALFCGAALYLVGKEIIKNYVLFEGFLQTHCITVVTFPPPYLVHLEPAKITTLRKLITAGSETNVDLLNRWKEKADYINAYGPTEVSICVTCWQAMNAPSPYPYSSVPIGSPIFNSRVFILEKNFGLQPLGIVGELYVGGVGVSRGYLNNPELTFEKFDHDLWDLQDYHDEEKKVTIKKYNKKFLRGALRKAQSAMRLPPGRRRQKLYITGDLARWLPDGNIEFLGRIDHQVKIRGFRIELGEIENQLLKYQAIKEAVVIDRETGEDKYLCAYIAAADAASISIESLRKFLSQFLPDYMIPTYFIPVKKIPLTPNGKVDRKALPEPKPESGKEYTAPRNRIEEKLVTIWQEILGDRVHTAVGIDDNFFELGGHSLKATIMISGIHKAFNVKLSLGELFKNPFIRKLSKYIQKSAPDQFKIINVMEKKEYYTLSSAQKRLYILQQMDLKSTVYNMPGVIPLAGTISIDQLKRTFNQLLARHNSLRTSYHLVKEEPVQKIHDKVEFEIEYYDLQVTGEGDRSRWEADTESTEERRQMTEGKPDTHLSSVIRHLSSEFIRPFDLFKAPLLRVGLIKPPHTLFALHGPPSQEGRENKYLLIVDMHHIISDGLSHEILKREFTRLYENKSLPPLRIQYKDFSEWQNNKKEKQRIKEQQAYWLKEFQEEIPVLHLPTDYPRPAIQSFAGDTCDFELEEDLTRPMKELSLAEGATLFMVLLAAVNILLAKLSGQEEIVIGTPTAGRRHADLEKIIGMFVNTLALKNYPHGEKPFNLFLREIKERTLEAFENQEYQFEDLVNNVCVTRDTSRNPLFDVMFSLQSTISKTPGKSDAEKPAEIFPTIENHHNYENRTAKFDLTITTVETANKLLFPFHYCTKLFKKETIERFITYFKKIVAAIVEDPTVKLREIDILPGEEKQKILYNFNDTDAVYPLAVIACQLFEEQAKKHPHSIAVMGTAPGVGTRFIAPDPGKRNIYITYHELNKKSNQLARLLKAKGLHPDAIAGIIIEQSIEMVIGILAILKASGAYLPIDPQYPQQRIMFFLQDSRSNLVLTQKKLISKQGTICEIIDLEEPNLYKGDPGNLEMLNKPTDLAYVIYTSGSTGTPKGTLIRHHSLNNLCNWHNKYYSVTTRDRATKYAGFGFDASVWEIFPYLISGASLYIIHKEIKSDIHRLNRFFEENNITIAFLPTPICEQFRTLQNHSLRVLLTGGDKLRTYIKRNYQLVNNYGPTENTVVATSFRVDRDYVNIPIGKPISNTKLYVLNQYRQLQPPGVPGELYISGSGLSRGYLNQPELTMERICLRRPGGLFSRKPPREASGTPRKSFLLKRPDKVHLPSFHHASIQSCNHATMQLSPHHSPHYPITPLPHSPIYRTGDLARWLLDGNMEFLGRIDLQVKVRGYRIELAEIENQLLKHDRIEETAVIARETQTGDKYLSAYIVFDKDREFKVPELREYLAKTLPDYMIPSFFVRLEKIPLTPNGKVDRKSLPEPELASIVEYAAPRNEVEQKLVEIWSEVLARDSIGIDDHFFELGGHSLKAIALTAKIHQLLNIKVSLTEIFKRPTIRQLSRYIEQENKDQHISITNVEKKEYYRLSSAQERLYLLYQMAPDTTFYNIPSMMQLEGAIEKNKLEETFKKLIRRYESLRTSFHMIADEPVQRVHDKVEFKIEYFDLAAENRRQETEDRRQTTGGKSDIHLSSVIRHPSSEFVRPFDLSRVPLLRVGLTQLEEEKHLLMLDMHHIICDGSSIEILVKDFMSFYALKELPGKKLQYKDYSRWQRGDQEKKLIIKQEQYWLKQFAEEIPVLDLPADFARPIVQSFEGSTIKFEIDRKSTEALKTIALNNETTLYMVLLTITNIFLSKISSQEDIVIGTPVAGRRHAELEDIIGMFVNTLALRNQPCGDKTFPRFLKEVKNRTLESFENQDYPFEELVETLPNLTRDAGRNPLFDVIFAFQNWEFTNIEIPGLTLKSYPFESEISKFDLTLQSIDREDRLEFSFEYCTNLFRKKTIQRFIDYFKLIIISVVREPNARIGELEIISGEEKRKVLYDFNDTGADYPGDKTIHELFAGQVEKTPDHIALVGEEGTRGLAPLSGVIYITYNQLNERSNQLAHLLRGKGLKPDNIVGIMVERSIEMIIGILSILKAGAAYLPIDTDYPESRVKYIIKDTNTGLLLTKKDFVNVDLYKDITETMDLEEPNIYKGNKRDLEPVVTAPGDLCYVMYTSGSTGGPKGVIVKHRNVTRLVKNTNYVELSEATRILQTGAPVFDATTFETWGTLLNGGQLVLANKEVILDVDKLAEALRNYQINVLWLTAPLFNQLVQQNSDMFSVLEWLLVGGDVLSPKHINMVRSRNKKLKVVNGYGPTENATFSTCYLINKDFESNIPIGKPISNSTVYILDNNYRLQPIGVVGELCVGGDGVSRGYINNPELTNSKFQRGWHPQPIINYKQITNPKGGNKKGPVKRIYMSYMSHTSYIYKTGDLARWLLDGNIDFLGRRDQQVKIRGFRIELGEIEIQLSNHPGIKECVVLASADEVDDKSLCAYIVSSGKLEISDLREYLAKLLPGYMIPTYFIPLDHIPLSPNGKVHRSALPVPEISEDDRYTAPGDEVEEKLVRIWAEVLEVDRGTIGIDANFFELGGHSLKATTLMAKVHKEFGVKLPLSEIFVAPNIKSMASSIKGATKNKYISIEAAEKKDYYPLSSAQKRLYVIHRLEPGETTYNMPTVMILEGKLDKNKIENTFKNLIRRHESLRTSFGIVNDEPVQKIHGDFEFQIQHFDFKSAQVEAEAKVEEGEGTRSTINSFILPFDLSKAPLLRVGLINTPRPKGHPSQEGNYQDRHILMVDMHHIISDGFSSEIFVKDLISLYMGEIPAELKLQYKDFSHWQSQQILAGEMKKQETYWLKEFQKKPAVPDIPTDYPRPAKRTNEGAVAIFKITPGEVEKLRELAKKENATMFMVALTLYSILLAKITNQEDIVMGTIIAGRKHLDLENIIGFFVNTLVLRNYPKGEYSFSEFLRKIRKRTLDAFDNQDYQFEDLVENVMDKREQGRNPLFDVLFNFISPNITRPGIPRKTANVKDHGLKVRPYDNDKGNQTKFDLVFASTDPGDNITFAIQYSTELFQKETIEKFIEYFKEIVTAVRENDNVRLRDIKVSHDLDTAASGVYEDDEIEFEF